MCIIDGMAPKTCTVSVTDASGSRHSVEVLAESLYEAAALGLKLLRDAEWVDTLGPMTRLQLQVRAPTVMHEVTIQQLQRWLDGGLILVCDRYTASSVAYGEAFGLDRKGKLDAPRALVALAREVLKAADDKKVLWSFDFSQIEARVLAWLAGQHDILAVFASGQDVYTWAAGQFGSSDRQLGKVLVLALGFGMGATKLRETAWKAYGVRLTASQAEKFKHLWRAANHKIVNFWYEMENAAQAAILRQGQVVPVGGSGVAFTCTTRTLQMRLPSGRVLYYHRPRLDRDTGSIVYWGSEVGGRWVEQRTWGGKLAENATQAAARDIMSEAMLRAFRRGGHVPCMTVHDELVYPVLWGPKAGPGLPMLRDLQDLMLEPPPWAGGLPLAGEHKIMRRYGIDVPHKAIAKPA
jgi:hypothetical protein